MTIRIWIRVQIWIGIIIEIWIFLKNNHDNFVLRTFIPSFKKAESDFLPGSKEGSGRGRGRGALRGQRGRGRSRGAGPPAKVFTPGTYNLQVGTVLPIFQYEPTYHHDADPDPDLFNIFLK